MFHNTKFGRSVFSRDLQIGEEIIHVGHVHSIFIVKDLILYLIVGVLVPFGLFTIEPNEFSVTLAGFLAISSFIRFYIKIVLWYFDCWVITNKAVIDYYWANIFSKKVIRMEYNTLEGIAHEVKGFWNTILNKGKIQLLKHSDHNDVTLSNASNPKLIEQKILQAMKDHAEQNAPQQSEKHVLIQELLSEMLADYARDKGIDLHN